MVKPRTTVCAHGWHDRCEGVVQDMKGGRYGGKSWKCPCECGCAEREENRGPDPNNP